MFFRFILAILVVCSGLSAESSAAKSSKKISIDRALLKRKPPVGVLPSYRVLKNPSYHPGFFSALFTVIGFLDDFTKEKWLGIVIDFENQGSYYEPTKGLNWWHYYFKPVSDKPVGLYEELCVVEDLKMSYGFNTLFRSRAEVYQTIQKYIRPNETVSCEVEYFAGTNFNHEFVIGVNYLRPEKANNGNKTPSFQSFYDKIDFIAKEQNLHDYKIYASTDDATFLAELLEKYGSKIAYRDIPRGDEVVPLAYESATPNYDRGFDEIVDCLLLAKCDVVVRTNTNITTAASFFNPDLKLVTIKSLVVPRRN